MPVTGPLPIGLRTIGSVTGLRPVGLRPVGLRPVGLRPVGLRLVGLQPAGLRPAGLRLGDMTDMTEEHMEEHM